MTDSNMPRPRPQVALNVYDTTSEHWVLDVVDEHWDETDEQEDTDEELDEQPRQQPGGGGGAGATPAERLIVGSSSGPSEELVRVWFGEQVSKPCASTCRPGGI